MPTATALALLVALSAGAARADYGEQICRQHGANIPIACAGAPLEDE